jgi:hypothetical protein
MRINPRNSVELLTLWRKSTSASVFNRAISKIERMSIKELKLRTPVRTGRLRNSMTTLLKTPSKGIDLRSGLKIGSRLPYGKFVDQGTKRSSGRYVPVLGRRVKTGSHPGVRARNFVQASKPIIEEKSKMILEQFMKEWRSKLRL